MSTINQKQRITIMKTYTQVCKERGWKSSDRAFRMAKFSEIIGREIASSDEIGRIDECTKLMKELKAMLGVDLQAAREADDLTINRARVLRNQIAGELVPCLELYEADVPAYMTEIMADKNRWWKIDRPVCEITIMDLDAKPVHRWNPKKKEMQDFPSQLEQLQYTLQARLNTKRNEAGETIHEMKKRACIPCHCSRCNPRRPVMLVLPPLAQAQLEADDVPDEKKPF